MLDLAKADGSYLKAMAAIARVDVLVIDDWGLAPIALSTAPIESS